MATMKGSRIWTFLWFDDKAEEAAEFYTSIFPDSRINRVHVMPADSPSGPAGSVKVVDFTLFGQHFQAMSAGAHHTFNDAVSIMVVCDDQEELDRYWSALLEGGGKEVACGWLNDRYGVRWQIQPATIDDMMADEDPERGRRVAEAMMRMVKMDFAALEAAYRGEG